MASAVAALLAVLSLQTPAVVPPSSYVPNRVYDTSAAAFIDFETMVLALGRADVVFVGEQHDDPNTHRLEAALLEGLHRRGFHPSVSLEMFERDAQGAIDSYFLGRASEEDMLKTSRPWPRYATDYRALVELAKTHRWPLVAANVPRPVAADVAKRGKDVLARLTESQRPLVAADVQCPADEYFERFVKTMSGHPAGTQTPEQQRAMVERYYWAQCVKDETMAESIAAALKTRQGGKGPVVHFNGAFHSDFALGTVQRVARRDPSSKLIVVTILPVTDLDGLAPSGDDLRRGNYLVYTVK